MLSCRCYIFSGFIICFTHQDVCGLRPSIRLHIYIYNSLIYKLPFAAPIKRMKNIKSRNCLSKLLIKLFGFPTLSQIFFCKKTPQRPSNGRVEKTCLAGVFLSPGNSHFWGSGFLKRDKKQLKIFHSTRITQVEETPPAWGSLVTKILPRQRHGTKCTNSFLALKDHIPLTPSDLYGIPLAVDLLHKFLLRCEINTVLFTSTPPPKKN